MPKFSLLRTKRQCKHCSSFSTSKSLRKNGTIAENWYIDKTCPQGGWLCLKCYNKSRRNSNTKCKEFEVSSIDPYNRNVIYV